MKRFILQLVFLLLGLSGAQCHGDTPAPLSPVTPETEQFRIKVVAPLPKGEKILYSHAQYGEEFSSIRAIRPDGSGMVDIVHLGSSGDDPVVSPDGKRFVFALSDYESSIIFVETDCCRKRFNLSLTHLFLVEGSDVVQLTGLQEKNVQDSPSGWSPDGKTIFFDRAANLRVDRENMRSLFEPRAVWAIDADGTNLRRIMEGSPSGISPDGKTMAVYRVEEIEGEFIGITYLVDMETLNSKFLSGRAWQCTFSPQGDRLSCFDRATWNIGLYDLAGKLITELTGFDVEVSDGTSWSPDGKWLAYVLREPEGRSVWKLPVDGSSPPVRLTDAGLWNDYVNWGR